MDHVNGLDVSAYQSTVDWKRVQQDGYSFMYAKCTEALYTPDGCFAKNITGARAAGMLTGAYHFFSYNADPVAQAKHFLANYTPRNGDLAPMLDLEANTRNADDAIKRIAAFLEVVEKACGHRCVLYMGYYYWRDQLNSTDGFAGHPLWIAQYTTSLLPQTPSVWSRASLWQYSSSGAVDGIIGDVDLDRYMGTKDELIAELELRSVPC